VFFKSLKTPIKRLNGRLKIWKNIATQKYKPARQDFQEKKGLK
jgi:hypothetical protein